MSYIITINTTRELELHKKHLNYKERKFIIEVSDFLQRSTEDNKKIRETYQEMGNFVVRESNAVSNAITTSTPATSKPKCKACCACPETKKARDQCIMENGEENCGKLIEAHKQCMRDQGFNI